MYNDYGTSPHDLDEARMKMHQDSYLLIICFIMLYIFVPCVELRLQITNRGRSRAAATSLTIITKRFILDVAVELDPPLTTGL